MSNFLKVGVVATSLVMHEAKWEVHHHHEHDITAASTHCETQKMRALDQSNHSMCLAAVQKLG
jgi:hypothetical protein